MSELALQLIAENKKSQAKYLDLGNCGLKTLPMVLRECVWLEELVLSNVWREYDEVNIDWLDEKSGNKGDANELESLDGIEQLSALRKLVVAQASTDHQRNCLLDDLSVLAKNRALVYLDFRFTNVADLSFVSNLKDLKVLLFSSAPIADLSPLANLTKITKLSFRDTLVSDLSPLSKMVHLADLSCSNTKITSLEPLVELKKIKKLLCSSTLIAELSPLEQLNKLERLHCSGTLIKDLKPLAGLLKLRELYLQSTDIEDLGPLAKLKDLLKLGLSSTKVKDLSPLKKLKKLRALSLSSSQIDSLEDLAELENLQKIECGRTPVDDLSPLSGLKKLEYIDISKCRVTSLDHLSNLTKLTFLKCSDTLIAKITSINKLKSIKHLYINDTSVSDLKPIEKHTQLIELDFCHTLVEDLTPLAKLPSIKSVICYNSKIKDLTPLSECFSLVKLNCHSNEITDLSPLQELHNLEILDCSYTPIKDLDGLSNLSKLSQLFCSGTRIVDLGPLAELVNLEKLYFSVSDINSLEPLSKLSKLTKLRFFSTEIADLRPILPLIKKGRQVAWSQYRGDITVQNCPLIHPPIEIVKQENEAIINYFEELDRAKADDEVVRLAEAKCLIIGEGGAGKTSLARKLVDQDCALPKEEETTKGIQVYPLDMQLADGTDFRLNIWDFGGQEIYHATHQFFLTKRSLYLLVDDTRKDEKTVNDPLFNYWLQVAQLYGGNSPLLIIQNEKGDRSKQLDLGGMQHRFGFVKDSKATNLLHNRGLDEVWAAIQYWLRQLPHISEEQPKSWVDIRRELERLVHEENRDNISLQEYLTICNKYGIKERKRALFLSRYLHDFGAFLHFQDHPLLRKTLVLKNQWATDAVYRVLDSEAIKKKFGRFNETDLKTIWEEDSYVDQHPELLALMEKFELCYQLPNERISTWLAPQLLSVIPPSELHWNKSDNLQIRYEYEFMPRGLLSQHIVRMHRYILHPDLAWKSGVVFEREAAKALVTEEWGLRKINISANGRQAKELLTILSEDFDMMHERLEGLRVKKMIPCNCSECRNIPEPHFYNYINLSKRLQVGKQTVECQLSYEDVNVQRLLSGVFTENVNTEATKRGSLYEAGKTKLYLSFAKEDKAYQEELLKQLSALDREVSIWYDGLIPAGANVEESTKEALLEADIVLLLVSANSIANNNIQTIELPVIQAREVAGECILVPIIVNYCLWDMLDFAKHNSLPAKGIPITAPSWQNEAHAWSEVVKGVKELI